MSHHVPPCAANPGAWEGRGVGKWVVASCTVAKGRQWVLLDTSSHHRKQGEVSRGSPPSSDTTSYFSATRFRSKDAGPGSQCTRKTEQLSPGRTITLEPGMVFVHIHECMCMPWYPCAGGPHAPVCCGSITGAAIHLHVYLSKHVLSHVCVLLALLCSMWTVFCVLMSKVCHKPQYGCTVV